MQITPLFRGTYPFARGRGNRTISFRWTVSRQHASADTAGTFLRGHAATVPINVTLQVADGANADSYSGVMAEVFGVGRTGRETVFGYAIEGAVLLAQETDSGGAPPPAPPPTDPG